MKFWLHIHNVAVNQILDLAKIAEDAGFEGVLDGDHWATPPSVRRDPSHLEGGKPALDPDWSCPDNFVTGGMIAAVTNRIKFGTSVFILANRNNPVLVAKAAGTAAILGGHRFILGVGVGWMRDEYDIARISWKERGPRTEEAIEVLRKLWGPGPVEHHGKFFDFPPIFVEPSPNRQIPIYIGGSAPPVLHRAGRIGDGWFGERHFLNELPEIIATINASRSEAGRSYLPFDMIVSFKDANTLDNYKRAEDMGITGMYYGPLHYPTALGKRHSTLEEKRRAIEEFANNFIVRLAT